MNNIEELKQSVAKLESGLIELARAQVEVSNWQDQNLTRRDGSIAQDTRNDEMGRQADMKLMLAQRQVDEQKTSIVAAVNAI
jgi:hypothetical protein